MSRARWSLVLGCALMACGSTLPTRGADELVHGGAMARSPEDVFGRVVRVRVNNSVVQGELLACDELGVYLRVSTPTTERWEVIDWNEMRATEMRESGAGPYLLLWTGLGTLSSLSHRLWAVISGPLWALAGSITTGLAWSESETLIRCRDAAQFARFPQGLPPIWRARFDLPRQTPLPPASSQLVAPWTPR